MMRLFLKFALLGIVVLGTALGQTASKRSLVATLKNNSVADGCGCYFRFRGTPETSSRYVFFSSIEDDEKTAWMNIEGRDVKLSLTKRSDPKGDKGPGSKSTRSYVAGEISVDASYVTTRVCKPNDENCESTGYAAVFVVRKGPRMQVVKATGGCGC